MRFTNIASAVFIGIAAVHAAPISADSFSSDVTEITPEFEIEDIDSTDLDARDITIDEESAFDITPADIEASSADAGVDFSGVTFEARDIEEAGVTFEARDIEEAGVTFEARDIEEAGVTFEARDIEEAGVTFDARDIAEAGVDFSGVTFEARDVAEAGVDFSGVQAESYHDELPEFDVASLIDSGKAKSGQSRPQVGIVVYPSKPITCRATDNGRWGKYDAQTYTVNQLTAGITKAAQLQAQGKQVGDQLYPHNFNNNENLAFNCGSDPKQEFALELSGQTFGRGNDKSGPDRVVYSTKLDKKNNLLVTFCGVMRHGPDNKFFKCE